VENATMQYLKNSCDNNRTV